MDKSITARSEAGGPALVAANWYKFAPSQRIRHPNVASVSLIWALEGSGEIRSRGESFRLDRTQLVVLPWRHDVEYRADARAPFHIGTLHLVPWHDVTVPVEPRVAHRAGDQLAEAAWRRDDDPARRPRAYSTFTPQGRRLVSLASLSVETFRGRPATENSMRAFGVLVTDARRDCEELASLITARPAALELMMDYVLRRLDEPLSVAQIAAAADCSPSTASRLFTKHTGQSVRSWVRARRLEEAALLLRTTGMRVGEVARRVGYSDPLYFSRIFHEAFSVPPSRYAAGELRP